MGCKARNAKVHFAVKCTPVSNVPILSFLATLRAIRQFAAWQIALEWGHYESKKYAR
jgi:hypothetical protein